VINQDTPSTTLDHSSKLRAPQRSRPVIQSVWKSVVAKTPLKDPTRPWTDTDFERHWRGADGKQGRLIFHPPEGGRSETSSASAPDPEPPDDNSPHLAAIPEYPVQAVSGPLRALVDSCTHSGLPAALAAAAGLGALATVSGQAELHIYETWTVRSSLWISLIAPSGGGKTPVINISRRTLRDLDAAEHADLRKQMADWLELPKKDRGERPMDRTRLIGDITTEMVARWLDHGDGTGGVDADELSEFLRSLSKYRQGGGTDAGRWLALWSTQPWRYQRVGSDIDILIPRPVLTVCGGIQPHLIHLLGPKATGCGRAGCRTCP
jgi:hypothetical protein